MKYLAIAVVACGTVFLCQAGLLGAFATPLVLIICLFTIHDCGAQDTSITLARVRNKPELEDKTSGE